jgi:hypothetical protein
LIHPHFAVFSPVGNAVWFTWQKASCGVTSLAACHAPRVHDNVYSCSVVKYLCIFNLYIEKSTVLILFLRVNGGRNKINIKT